MLNILNRNNRSGPPGSMVICQFCGNATPFATGGTCPHCGVAVSTFDAGKLEKAHESPVMGVRMLRGDHGMLPNDDVRGGYYDRAGTWVRLLDERFEMASMKTATDIGSGSNYFLTKLAHRFPNLQCRGFDFKPSDPAPDLRDRLKVEQLNLEDGKIPLGDRSQDLIVCSHVLEHVENAHQLLSEILRVGKNVLIILPNGMDVWTLARSVLRDGPAQPYGMPLERPADRHRWIFTPTQAVKLMRHWAGRTNRNLEVVHLTHPRFPVSFGRLSANLFVAETAFFLTER